MKIITEHKLIKAVQETVNYFETTKRYDDILHENVEKYSKEDAVIVKSVLKRLFINLGYHPMKKNFPLYKINSKDDEG